MDEILREAENLMAKQQQFDIECENDEIVNSFGKWKMDEHLKTISEESTPREMKLKNCEDGAADIKRKNETAATRSWKIENEQECVASFFYF